MPKNRHSSNNKISYGLGNFSKQMPYFHHLKQVLEARETKAAATLYRRKLLEHQNKVNYVNELHRIKGMLSQNDTRLPIATRERLMNRQRNLHQLGHKIADEIK